MSQPTYEKIVAAYPPGTAILSYTPVARFARYDRETQRIVVELSNGCEFAFPARLGQWLKDATDEQLATVKVTNHGSGLEWEELGTDLSVEGILDGRFGNERWMQALGLATGVKFLKPLSVDEIRDWE